MKFFEKLFFGRNRTSSEYERGVEDALRFLSTNPEKNEFRIHYSHADCSRDEYDRGYLHTLIDSPKMSQETD